MVVAVIALAWYWQLAIAVAMLALSYALTPKPAAPKNAAVGQADLPTNEENTIVPMVFGSVRIKQSYILSTFNRVAKPIREKVG